MSVFMAEDVGLCTYEKHHQQKLVLFLAAMRAYADELRQAGYELDYVSLDTTDTRPYEEKLAEAMGACGSKRLVHFEIEDKPMEQRLVDWANAEGIEDGTFRKPEPAESARGGDETEPEAASLRSRTTSFYGVPTASRLATRRS